MKSTIASITFLLLSCNVLFAQNKPYNVVFDITSKDTIDHRMVIRWVTEISDEHPDANIEVVFYGKSLDLIVQGKSMAADKVMELVKRKNVTFDVCAVAMKNNKVEKTQLLPGVKIVPDGIYEVISKQQDGWGYIKVSH